MAITDAWQVAADELGIQVTSPFTLDDDSGSIVCPAMISGFGSPLGTVILPLDSPDRERLPSAAQRVGYSYSLLGRPYDRFDRDFFIETLNDWGWKGDPDNRPDWCTDEPWTK